MPRLYHLTFLIVLLPSVVWAAQKPLQIISLDGTDWRIAKDSDNVGQAEKWFNAVRPDTKPIRVPWILEDAFPDYDGVVWYYKNLKLLRIHTGPLSKTDDHFLDFGRSNSKPTSGSMENILANMRAVKLRLPSMQLMPSSLAR